MQDILWILAIIFLIFLCCLCYSGASATYQEQISKWATENKYEVVKCEECWFCMGPFYYKNDDQHIYKTTLRDMQTEKEQIFWFRVGIFGMDREIEY